MPYGGKDCIKYIQEEMKKFAIDNLETTFHEIYTLNEDDAEEIMIRGGFLNDDHNEIEVKYPLNNLTLKIPSNITRDFCKDLFIGKEENSSLIELFLNAILELPIDLRMNLILNVIIVGGMSMIPGFIKKFNKQVNLFLKENKNKPPYDVLNALEGRIVFVKINYPSLYGPWIGASILGSLNDMGKRGISLEDYKDSPFLLENWNRIESPIS